MEKATCAPHNPVMTSAKSLAAKEQLNSAVAVNPTLTLQIYSEQISNIFPISPKVPDDVVNFLVYSGLTFSPPPHTFSMHLETFFSVYLYAHTALVHFKQNNSVYF